jgi:two-component system CheB/CheR fusion protein
VPASKSDPRDVERGFRSHLWRATAWPVAACAGAAAVLVALVLHLQTLNAWVDHTDVVLARAELVERLVVDLEATLRGYLLTGEPRFLEAYHRAEGHLDRELDGLAGLVRDDPPQVARLGPVRAGVDAWKAHADAQLDRHGGGAPAEVLARGLLRGSGVSAGTRANLQEFARVEQALREERVRRAGAVTRWALLAVLALAVVAGPALALVTGRHLRTVRDRYHEALEAEAAAARSRRESEEKLRLAKDAARMGAWHWDLCTGELSWSERTRALFGLSADAPVTTDAFVATVHADDQAAVRAALAGALERGEPFHAEVRVPLADGGVRWVESRGEATRDAGGRPVRLAGMAMDVTARKAAEEALREEDRRKDEFLSMLSHELRNPLAPIRTSVHILGRVDPSSEPAARARAVIARQVDHLTRLVEDLLDVTRISSGKLRLHRERMDLGRRVRESVEDLRPLFAHREIALELRAPHGPVFVDGDPTRVAQVVSNLLQNAAKFTDPGGRVEVSVEGAGADVRVRVRDDGVGIAPEVLGRLFAPFVQGDSTLDRSRGGLGLGLALVRGVVELHGGHVEALSDGPGRGTEVVVTLPAAREAEPRAQPAPAPPPAGDGRRVLIIEDNADAADSLRDLVALAGAREIHVARDGEAGVAAARRLRPDLILCDIGLPKLDGYEVARRIRGDGAARRPQLVAISGYASPEDLGRATEAGFDAHLPKPPDVDRVLALVAGR